MLNVEQYKRYLALQTRLHGNSMLNVEEYSEYIKLHTQFQDSIFAQPTVSNELINHIRFYRRGYDRRQRRCRWMRIRIKRFWWYPNYMRLWLQRCCAEGDTQSVYLYGVKSIPKEQIHLVKQLLIRKDVIGAKKGKASKEFNNMGMYNVAEYVGAIKSVLTDKTAVINAIHHWRKEKSETRKKKVLKTIRWFTGNKNDIKEVKTELNGIRWRNDALCAFNDNKQNRMFLQKVRAYLNAFGLTLNWLSHEKVFCNPPYDIIQAWAEKCFHTLTEAKRTNQPIEIHLLIPARTETDYFHEYIKSFAEIHFIRGRLKFRDLTGVSKKPIRAPFSSIVCIYKHA